MRRLELKRKVKRKANQIINNPFTSAQTPSQIRAFKREALRAILLNLRFFICREKPPQDVASKHERKA